VERKAAGPDSLAADAEAAAEVLAAGGVVAFPAERLYGLGADAASERAVRKVFELKGRDRGSPLPVIVDGVDRAGQWVYFPGPAPELAEAFWPGPLTLVLPSKGGLAKAVYGAGDELGIRVPAAELAREMARRLGRPVTATSANLSGRAAWTRVDNADPELIERCDLVLDAGELPGPPPSTVARVTESGVEILREGAISRTEIDKVLGRM